MPDIDPRELGALAANVAQGAGALLLARLGDAHEVWTKSSDTDVVTQVDRDSEAMIVRRILEVRPDDGFLGEEGGERAGSTGVRWVIDPLDGTVNYLYGRAAFAVSVGVEVNGETVAGAVFDPAAAELFAAVRGEGATLNGHPIHPTGEVSLSQALVGTGFGYEAAVRERQGPILARVLPRVRDVRRAGAAALDLCAVACGRLDAYYERGVQPWDVAAATLIVREAGGVAGSLDGTPAGPASTWVASNAALAEAFRALIAEASSIP